MLYDDRRRITIQRDLTSGGEGKICTIHEDSTLVLKLLHHPSSEAGAKIAAMIANPPHHDGITWPRHAVRDERGQHVGHLMHYVRGAVPLPLVVNPANRANHSPGFNWQYLVHTAANIAGITTELHARPYVIGDLADMNFLVYHNATVTLVDTDSMQVPRPKQRGYFRCTVGTQEYTPPELLSIDFRTIDRSVQHDNHALAVLLFRLLMDGVHPFASKWNGTGQPPSLVEKVRAGLWPYWNHAQLQPPSSAPSLTILPPNLQALCRRGFVDGHHNPSARPTANEWHDALTQLARNLVPCRACQHHVYSNHLNNCPWCERATRLGIDSFSPARTVARPYAKLSAPPTPRPTTRPLSIAFPKLVPHATPLSLVDDTGWYKFTGDVSIFYEIARQPNATPSVRQAALDSAAKFSNLSWNVWTGEQRFK